MTIISIYLSEERKERLVNYANKKLLNKNLLKGEKLEKSLVNEAIRNLIDENA